MNPELTVEQRLADYLYRNGMTPNYRLDETVAEIMDIVSPKVEAPIVPPLKIKTYKVPA